MKKCAFVYLSFILLMFFFNGCFFYKEKLWLNKDGSGKMVMKIGIDKNLNSMRDSTDRFGTEIDKFSSVLDSVDGVTNKETKSYFDKDKKWFEISFAFESLKFVNELEDKDAAGLIGEISILRTKMKISFSHEKWNLKKVKKKKIL